MANEIRLRRNNMSGTITDNPLAQVSTTINSAGFVDLPTIGGTNHLILILDPLEINGPAEIVMVTAHTAAASSVTVTRGVEGSAPRAHILGTTWFHGPVTSDTVEVLTSSTRPTIPYEGEFIYETDTNKFVGYGGVDWAPRDAGGQLGYAQVTANQGSITTEVDLTGLTVTVTVGSSRRIRVTGQLTFTNTGTNQNVGSIKEGTTFLSQTALISGAAGIAESMHWSAILTPSAGIHTYKLTFSATAGTASTNTNTNNPVYILVEDIGAA